MDLLQLAGRAQQALQQVTDHVDAYFDWFRSPAAIIAENTASAAKKNATMKTVEQMLNSTRAALPMATSEAASVAESGRMPDQLLSLQSLRGMFNILNYVISRWNITTIVVAIILNRTQFYASSRRHLQLTWPVRLLLYIMPIILLSWQALNLVRALRCQTSPDWSQHRYEQTNKTFDLDFAGDGGAIYYLASNLLPMESEQDSCRAVGFSRSPSVRSNYSGSLSLLWPTFVTLCFSQIVESLSCTLQGTRALYETSIFEHSLAFSEAEAMVLKPFEVAIAENAASEKSVKLRGGVPLSRKNVLRMMNVAPEILLITLVSCTSNIISNILAVFGLRRRLRLYNTALLGFAYLAVFAWSIARAFVYNESQTTAEWILRFPTVFLVGYIPHVLLLTGIILCGLIYSLAFIITVLSPPPGQPRLMTMRERASYAYQNLQAHIYLTTATPLTIKPEDDFFTAVLNIGFAFVTAASDAVYLKEAQQISAPESTWLERDRLRSLVQRRGFLHDRTMQALPAELRPQVLASIGANRQSGYAIERRAYAENDRDYPTMATAAGSGTGFVARTGRLYMAGRLIQSVAWLSLGLFARLILHIMQKLGLNRIPRWLSRLAYKESRNPLFTTVPEPVVRSSGWAPLWLSSTDRFKLSRDANIDVEAELRRQLRLNGMEESRRDERVIDNTLYDWWKTGGWWGEIDNSGEYQPSTHELEEDTTSVVSADDDADQDSLSTGEDVRRSVSRAPEDNGGVSDEEHDPDIMDMEHLASLLDPSSAEARTDGRMLARRLRRQNVLTRSQHQREAWRDTASVLLPRRRRSQVASTGIDEEDEERALEQLILSKRRVAQESGGAGDQTASSGPQCVICQDEPRTVLLWPCGHLALCDDCRVNMASRNFNRCVVCRKQTSAYSRLYAP